MAILFTFGSAAADRQAGMELMAIIYGAMAVAWLVGRVVRRLRGRRA